MIWLSNSALRYAVDVCDEIPNYRAIVYIRRAQDGTDIKDKLRTYLKNTRATTVDVEQNWHAYFENGSRIDIVAVTDQVYGRTCYIAIVDAGIDRNTIDTVILPTERQTGTINTFDDQPLWEENIDELPHTFRGVATDHTILDQLNTGGIIDANMIPDAITNTRDILENIGQIAATTTIGVDGVAEGITNQLRDTINAITIDRDDTPITTIHYNWANQNINF